MSISQQGSNSATNNTDTPSEIRAVDIEKDVVAPGPGEYKKYLKTEVQKFLRSRKLRQEKVSLNELPRNAHSSSVLKYFLRVNVENNPTEFIVCKKCDSLLTYVPENGTSGMQKHTKASCKALEEDPSSKQQSMDDFVGFPPPKISANVRQIIIVQSHIFNYFNFMNFQQLKNDAVKKATNMCATDLSQFSLLEKQGFTEFAQFLINTGAQFGKVEASKLLPKKSTVSQAIHLSYENTMAKLRADVTEVCDSNLHKFF